MSETLISVRNLCRRYGTVQAVTDTNLSVSKGSIVGLLGTNGAGKTTLIRLLMGHLYPDSGTVEVLGTNPRKHTAQTRQRVAYVSERMELPGRMCLNDVLKLNRQFFPKWNVELATQLTKEFDIDPRARLSRLSLGQKRRAVLLQAICQSADLLILDEPFSGLDAIFRRQCLDMLMTVAIDYGQTILVSSHLLNDVERLVDRVALMKQGTVFQTGDLEQLKARMRMVRVPGELNSLPELPVSDVRVFGNRTTRGETKFVLDGYSDDMQQSLVTTFGDNIRVEHMNLEDIFVELSSDNSGQSKGSVI